MASDEEQARKDARWARYKAQERRAGAKIQLAMVPLWVGIAVAGWIWGNDSLSQWLWTALAVFQLGNGYLQWRVLRRPLPAAPGQQAGPGR